ncbi:MAG: cell division protein ZapE [Aaplasma endosymbiont of Hyalomma asiaticum]
MGGGLDNLFKVYNDMVARHEIVFDELQVTILKELGKYINTTSKKWKFWEKHTTSPKRGVYLYGDVGRGKSLISCLFYDHCGVARKKKVHFNTFMKQIHNFLHQTRIGNSVKTDYDQMEVCINAFIGDADLLYLDEIQVRDICEAVILHRVFSILFSRKITVFMTSNYHPRKLYEDGIQKELFDPAVKIIEERMEVMSLSGNTDYRYAAKNSNARSYCCRFYVGEKAGVKLKERYDEIVGLKREEKATFIFDNGRKIHMGKACGGVAWFCFDELCGNRNPLWASDYKKVTERFRTIFIDNIPIFDFYSQNEMQRFIVLVDELYEQKNLLFCSMASEIRHIYQGVLTVDIKRAMSRLYEMSSEKWEYAHNTKTAQSISSSNL